ncbi:hypothetical protein HZF02_01655 [Pseudomonas yamanorum]|nr:hypothetical protein HZF02_01655 [Pseudomonas yamanorum]
MSITETPTSIPPELDRITIVLKPQEGSTLNQVRQFARLGAPVAIGRGIAVIAGASDEDLFQVLGQERDERWMQAQLQQEAMGAPAHLAAHAQEMFDLLRRINVKVGGLNAVVGHGAEPSDQMWEEHDEAMDAIWDLLAKVKSAASVDAGPAEQSTQNPGSLITENPIVAESPYSEVRVKNIDVWIQTLENAKRYEWLRDRDRLKDDDDLMVVRDSAIFHGDGLDKEIDDAMRLARLEELHPCAD